ncbi:MAG TPA: VOC family protein [Acidimicrobiales bacterium]|nr:VOC family protein [Acidimicrobiales bacterium]
MRPYVSIITLGVPDLAAARRFYVDGLGWPVVMEVEDEVVFLQVGHGLALALWGAEKLAADIGPGTPVGDPAQGAVALAHNVGTDQEVGRVLAEAEAAGGTILAPPRPAVFGGLQGYFADPAGHRWEVAHNPTFAVADDGSVSI